jgi:hypothetical protein
MTRETRVGLAAIATLVGFIGWSIAEGVGNRPTATSAAPVPAAVSHDGHEGAVEPAAGESPCCKDKGHHADHSSCKMKKPEPAPVASDAKSAAKCPYMAGRTAPASQK